jgi:hypothetical protein
MEPPSRKGGRLMNYCVKEIRDAGLNARWSKTSSGRPIIVARKGDRGSWYYVDGNMWTRAKCVGILQAFEEHTCLGEFFSVKL